MNVPYIKIYKALKRASIPASIIAHAATAIFILSLHGLNAQQQAEGFIASYQDNPQVAVDELLVQVERMESRKVKS
jgi:hypothetical protein